MIFKDKKFLIGLILVGVVFLIFLTINLAFAARVSPNVFAAGVSVSGKDKKELLEMLKKREEKFLEEEIIIEDTKIKTADLGISFENEKTVNKLLKENKPYLFSSKKTVPVYFNYDQEALSKKLLKIEKKKYNQALVNSRLVKNKESVEVVDGMAAKRINFAETEENFKKTVGSFGHEVTVASFLVGPTFTSDDFNGKDTFGEFGGLTLKTTEKIFRFENEQLVSWLVVNGSEKVLARQFEKEDFLNPIFDPQRTDSSFSESLIRNDLLKISAEIDQKPVNAQLNVTAGRATVFVPSREGRALNIDESIPRIVSALENKIAEVELSVEVTRPEVTEESLNNMGIVELLATGYSDFKGSPENRKHNIRTGASKFNGVLIKPNETFSFVKSLGAVDASTGYLPELVIKENKTVPEYGGGMCQVSSTAFRAALNAGLPILERSAHSYPVVYYKPFGVDASVYIPKPDLVFKNDTGKYILIQTRIEGTKLVFDFYGTKLNRRVAFAGNDRADGAATVVEQVNPLVYDQGVRGKDSFTAAFWRFIYDGTGKLITTNKYLSKYDSPDKYPH